MLHGTKTIIKHKIGLLNLAEELGNVSKACRIMRFSPDTFYRYQNAIEALIDQSRRKPNLKNSVSLSAPNVPLSKIADMHRYLYCFAFGMFVMARLHHGGLGLLFFQRGQ